jgi:16S rRNA (cytosine967-C5)-methyltransferase
VEIQDQGSQLISLIVEARRNETVVDFCAGAGGKSLLLAETMHDQGKVIALDTSPHRLERMEPRITRSGLSCIESHVVETENDPRLGQWHGKIDRVLVDAPCSGSGTLRRHPELKRQPADIDLLQKQQISILNAAAKLVKTGGRLVYATCSLLKQENDDVVAAFLAQHREFHILPINEVLTRLQIPLTMRDDTLKLLPHRHGTDGFFACVMQKYSQ